MARRYIADSSFLFSSSLVPEVRSDTTGFGGCAVVPGIGRVADGMSISPIAPTIG
jgi:hypothetical protein